MNVAKIRPTFNRVLVKKLTEEKTESGIFIPISVEDDSTFKVEIVAVGSEVSSFTPNQIGLLNKFSGVEVSINTGVYLVNEKDILAIIE